MLSAKVICDKHISNYCVRKTIDKLSNGKFLLSNKHRRFLNYAVETAKLSQYPQFKHGAVIVKAGNPVAVGVNRAINDFKAFDDDETAKNHTTVHAEVAAIKACVKTDLSNAVIYVARVGADGKARMSKPCTACQEAIKESGIKKIIYTMDNIINL